MLCDSNIVVIKIAWIIMNNRKTEWYKHKNSMNQGDWPYSSVLKPFILASQ